MNERLGAEGNYVDEIIKAVNQGARLTTDLLSFSRRQTLQPQHVSISEFLQRLQSTLLRSLGERVQITIEVRPDADGVWADPSLLEHAVLNLALNARDAMPDGGTLKIQCKQAARNANSTTGEASDLASSYVELSVADNGDGMSQPVLAQAFEPFFSTKPVGKGSGLGLSMVMGFARQSGGDVSIRSLPGEGTIVRVMLPASGGPTLSKLHRHKSTLPGRGEEIHLVEDNQAVRQVTQELLGALNYSVSVSRDGWEASEFIEQGNEPDLFILDAVLPGPSGIELAQNIRSRLPNVPIILLSGYPKDEVGDATGLVNVQILKKPTGSIELSTEIRKLLESRGRLKDPKREESK